MTEDEKPPILVEKKQNVATITFNRPQKHHAFDDVFIATLTEALQELQNNEKISLLIIQSTGKSFCSGADLAWMKRMVNFTQAENQADAQKLDKLMYELSTLCIPTIAIVQGNCFGGALGIIACCDIVIASNQAKFCFSEARLGLIPAVISPYVIKATNERWAKKVFMTAEVFDASEALKNQLVHEIVAPESLFDYSKKLIDIMQQNSPNALREIKKLTLELKPIPDEALRTYTAKAIAKIRVSKQAQEGMLAFFEKRQPKWIE